MLFPADTEYKQRQQRFCLSWLKWKHLQSIKPLKLSFGLWSLFVPVCPCVISFLMLKWRFFGDRATSASVPLEVGRSPHGAAMEWFPSTPGPSEVYNSPYMEKQLSRLYPKETHKRKCAIYGFLSFDPFFRRWCMSNLTHIVPVRSSLLAVIIYMSHRLKPPFLPIPAEVTVLNSQNIVWAYADIKIPVIGICCLSQWEFWKYLITQSQIFIVSSNIHSY